MNPGQVGGILVEYEEYLKNSRLSEIEERIGKVGLKWGVLRDIYDDYTRIQPDLYSAGHLLSEKLKKSPLAHIVHYRTKNPIHLLDKVVRKTEEKNKEINQ